MVNSNVDYKFVKLPFADDPKGQYMLYWHIQKLSNSSRKQNTTFKTF